MLGAVEQSLVDGQPVRGDQALLLVGKDHLVVVLLLFLLFFRGFVDVLALLLIPCPVGEASEEVLVEAVVLAHGGDAGISGLVDQLQQTTYKVRYNTFVLSSK